MKEELDKAIKWLKDAEKHLKDNEAQAKTEEEAEKKKKELENIKKKKLHWRRKSHNWASEWLVRSKDKFETILTNLGGEEEINMLDIAASYTIHFPPSLYNSLTEEQKEQFEKRFENDVKKHIDKVAEYFSPEEDGIKYVIMFVPSEVIFSKINEQRYYNIVKVALEKKVSICSPSIFLVIIDQLRLWNKIWEQYKDLDKITSEISKFWGNLKLFKERWEKIVKTVESNSEAIRKFNISARKLIEEGEKIKNREDSLLKKPPKEDLLEKPPKNLSE